MRSIRLWMHCMICIREGSLKKVKTVKNVLEKQKEIQTLFKLF